jgi:hypothetical protein
MTKIKAIPFKKEHFNLMDIRERELKVLEKSTDVQKKLEAIENYHSAMTVLLEGVVLGVVGFVPTIPGTLEVFLIPSKYVSENNIAFARLLKYYKKEVMPAYDWHRLQMIAPDDELHCRWAKFLGFEKEGVMRQWGYHKENHVMWSIVR